MIPTAPTGQEDGTPDTGDAWVLTGRISLRAVVRVSVVDADGRPVNAYPLTRPVTGRRPATPWAVHLADQQGRFGLLCADLDAKTPTGDPAADASRLSALLDELGMPHVVCASGPNGGRHVWVGLRERVDAVQVSALAHLLNAWLPTLDTAALLNPSSGCVRPPGSPHRLGGHSTVLKGSLTALTDPTVTGEQVSALIAHLADRVQTTHQHHPVGRRPVSVEDGLPFLSGPQRHLSAACRALLATPPSGDLSSVLWRILCGAAAARWRFADLAALADAPGLEHARTLRTGTTRTPRPAVGSSSPGAVLRRQWVRAVDRVAGLTPDRVARSDSSFDGRAELVTEVVRVVQARADCTPGRWGGTRAGLVHRRVLDALCLYHLQAVRADAVEADIRRLALTCGVDRETARRALLGLAADGWITRTQPASGRRGAHWSIDPAGAIHTRIGVALSQAVPRPHGTGAALRLALEAELANRLERGAHDAFAPRGGLGLAAGTAYARLTQPADTLTTARRVGWPPTQTRQLLDRLATHGLLTHDGRLWQHTERERLDQLAVELGTAGHLQRRNARYAIERAAWDWWHHELDRMRAPRPQHARRWCPTHSATARRPPINPRPSWFGGAGAHPRRRDGRADFAAARRALEHESGGRVRGVHGATKTASAGRWQWV